MTYQLDCNNGSAYAVVSYNVPVATSAPDAGNTATPPDSSSTNTSPGSTSSSASSGKGGGGALDPFWLLLFSIPLALRVTYSSRNPTVTGIRAARTAGNKPPTNPMASAHLSPPHSKTGETLKANTT